MKEWIDKAEVLPVENSAPAVDSLRHILNPYESRIDVAWIVVARKRLEDIRSGAVKAVPGEYVFAKLWNGLGNELPVRP